MPRFTCPSCHKPYYAPVTDVGRKFNCACGQRVQVPAPPKKTVLGKLDDDAAIYSKPVNEVIPPPLPVPDPEPPVRIVHHGQSHATAAANICSWLAIIAGTVGVLACPIFFSTAGIVLGITGYFLNKPKGVVMDYGVQGRSIGGFALSAVGFAYWLVAFMWLVYAESHPPRPAPIPWPRNQGWGLQN